LDEGIPVNGPKLFNKISVSTILIALLGLVSFSANALTKVTVLPVSNGVTGTVAISNYRWVIEEDQTYDVIAGETCMGGAAANPKAYKECLSLNFHRSHMPVIAQGRSTAAAPTSWTSLNLDTTKRYYLSILPDLSEGKSMGGVQIAAGQADAVIKVTTNQLPTAQIRIFIFQDTNPTNNTFQPGETGLEGFSIILEDAGGRYGISGQQINKDVYGNPLGTDYDVNGNAIPGTGDGVILSGPDGVVTIKNLAPAKYGIRAVPGKLHRDYVQTSTIEGTPTIDAWVKADEPAYFAEFGPPGPHVLMGFVPKAKNVIATETVTTAAGTTIIAGNITAIHNSRPPLFDFFSGGPISGCMVALNLKTNNVVGTNLFVSECDAEGNYSIPNVPVGNYSLSIWDKSLDYIFGQVAITVEADATSGQVIQLPPISPSLFAWFARLEQNVFYDTNENGIWDASEVGMPEVGTGIRWRDGTLYQGFPTDTTGAAPYDQVFPFFSWLVAEVDFSRYKSTGVTVQIDGGGKLPVDQTTGEVSSLNPQIQPGGGTSRTETGEVLTQAFQGFLGQTSIINWGKVVYPGTENGGISGIVYYALTRAEDEPKFAAPEVWEPGIPRIQVALYEDDGFGAIKDQDGNGIERADVDNAPFGWSTGGVIGTEDFDYNANGVFDAGDAIQITTTDSWDDSSPTGCVGDVYAIDGYTTDCFDGLRNFNQIRPGVFDGGYAFSSYFPGGIVSGAVEVAGLPIGNYIVGTGDHPAYETVKEEDKNVDFGVTFIQPNLLPPLCVGTRATPVPTEFSLFPGTTSDYLIAASAAATRPPLCNEKLVKLSGGQNSAADFFLFTQVPIAGHIMGFILNDLANEFDATAPTFGEKFSPPFIPVAIRDWQGNVIGRTYSDRWGSFNVLVPSTFTENLPTSSGISPNMLTACMNDPGPIKNAVGDMVIDPYYKKQYSQFCYTFNYMPGVTTYLDTPVLPIAAFAGIGQNALDCEYQSGTPVIWSTQGSQAGPVVINVGDNLTITSAGTSTVVNPESAVAGQPPTITRDYGFGAAKGTVTIEGIPVPDLSVTSWSDAGISINVPRSGNLEIIRADGRRTQAGIHVTVGGTVIPVTTTIQAAINSAKQGDTVVIPGGTYNEMVIMSKPIRLQGSGASTVINAANVPSTRLAQWASDVTGFVSGASAIADLLPMQERGRTPLEQLTLFTEAGAGIIVLAKNAPAGPGINEGGFGLIPVLDGAGEPVVGVDAEGNDVELKEPNARIDGVSITGSDNGGGIVVNGFARDLEISNNRVYGNFGIYSGGIRVGHPTLITAAENDYQNAFNTELRIHHNFVSGNGASNGYGGGISLNHGSDSYQVTKNYVCGNFTSGNGGGIGHYGFSNNGLIKDNVIIFNQSFKQQNSVSGGGIFIGGAPAVTQPGAAPVALTTPSPGTGKITIDANLIQGNNAGAGSGGGINVSSVNGREVTPSATKKTLNSLTITNNIIVNNVAGFAGGGIVLADAVRVNLVNNTIAHNDSSATSGDAFCSATPIPGVACVESTPQPAGVVSLGHSPSLANAIANSSLSAKDKAKLGAFSNPSFVNNIVWENRSFFFRINQDPALAPYELIYSGITDLAVVGAVGRIEPISSLLTVVPDIVVDNGNQVSEGNNIGPNLDPATTPAFVNDYVNGGIGQTVKQIELTTLLGVQPAFDEGGNFIDLRFGPLSLTLPRIAGTIDLGSNYHLTSASSAIASGDSSVLGDIINDIDNDARSEPIDIGADQYDNVNNVSPIVVNGVAINSVATTGGASKAASASNVTSGGGCTLQSNSRFDPLIPLLMMITLIFFVRRSLAKGKSITVVLRKGEV
jgi:hypothetical protein